MKLNKLTLSGFKSFAQPTTLNFGQGITAIVGPNGVGKSNIADAVRWVLGEQSKKNLRGKKGEDIIFAGSSKKNRLGLAEVSIIFNDIKEKISFLASGKNPLNFPEIDLKRRTYRDGEGEYFLNRGQVRLKDIEEFLAQTRISPKNYTLVGQGMIDKIVSLAPQEKRELFLEASQAKPLELRKKEAQRKLQRTQDNITKIQALISEVKPHLTSLKRQAKKAERKERTLQKLKETQKIWYQKKWKENFKEKQKTTRQKENLKNKIQNTKKQIKTLKISIEKAEENHLEYQKQWKNFHEKQSQIAQSKQKIQTEISALKGRLQAKEERPATKTQKEITQLQEEVKNIQKEISKLDNKNNTLNQDLKQKREERIKLQRQKKSSNQKQKTLLSYQAIRESLKKLLNIQKELKKDLKKESPIAVFKKRVTHFGTLIQETLSNLPQDSPEKKSFSDKNLGNKIAKLKSAEEKISASLHLYQEKINFLSYQGKTFQNKINLLKNNLPSNPSCQNKAEDLKTKLLSLKKEEQKQTLAVQKEEEKMRELLAKDQNGKEKIFNLERNLHKKQNQIDSLKNTISQINLTGQELEKQKQKLETEAQKNLGKDWRQIDPTLNQKLKNQDLELKIERLKRKVEVANSIDPEIIAEYKRTQKRFDFLTQENKDLEKASLKLNKLIKKLNFEIEERFNSAFKEINLTFKEYFRKLFAGGRASLNLDSDQGISIYACPPGKRLQNINMLSGGEKSLVGICLIFAIITQNPPPFCILDEVDAALDEENSIRFAKILKELSQKTQFITITHNRQTMKSAKTLYGVTMGEDGVSKLLSMRLEK